MARKSCAKAHFLPRMGHGLGQLDVQEMGTSPKVAKGQRKAPLSDRKAVLLWLRGLDLNQRPPGYELPSVSPSAAAQCFPDLLGPEMAQNPKVVLLRSTAIFSDLGQRLGQPLWFPQQEVALALHHVWHMVHRRPILYFRTIPLSDRERM